MSSRVKYIILVYWVAGPAIRQFPAQSPRFSKALKLESAEYCALISRILLILKAHDSSNKYQKIYT
jgi:hypothetical protein